MKAGGELPINISEEKTTLYNIIANDKYINDLGFLPENIYKHKNTVQKLNGNTKQIFIYNVQSSGTNNPIILGVNYQIDVICSENYQDIADKAIQQIIALIGGRKIANLNPVRLIPPSPTELQVANGFYCVAARFVFYSSIYNNLKKER